MPDYVITFVHLAAAVILLGGLTCIQLVVKPAVKSMASEAQKADCLRSIGRGFRTISWMCLITLILTGAYQMLNESGSARIETAWGVVLMLKLFFFAITFGLLLIHYFILDPYAAPSKSASRPSHPSIRIDLIQIAGLGMAFIVLLIASYLRSL